MDLTTYVDMVRAGVTDAATLADEHTQQVAARLGGALDSATRLALIRALSDAVGAVSAELAPIAVELRMTGAEPELVVQVPAAGSEPTMLLPSAPEPAESPELDLGEESVARISLRLPASVKNRVDEMADRDGISTNAWLVRAIMDALGDRRRGDPPAPPEPPAAPIFGLHGPFGPHGVFGPNGPFGASGLFGSESSERKPEHRRGNVQGWVR
jgi:hypothetical protein